MELTTKDWKEFRIGDLFKTYHGSRLKVKDRVEGNIPFITAGEEGRGIKEYVSNHRKLYENPITIDMFGNTFYHNLKLDGDDNVYFLVNEKLSYRVKLYISTVLNKVLTQRHSYTKQFRQNDLDKLTLLLPSKNDEPDWDFMEEFIKGIEEENKEKLAVLKDVKPVDDEIDISDWHEFRVGDLFEIRPTKHHKLTNAMLFDPDGKTPVVVNSSFDNGIGGFTTLDVTEKAPKITFSDTTDAEAIFLQTRDFAGYSHIQCLNPIVYENKWNEKTLMFFQIIFKAKAKTMSYNYTNKFTRASASMLIISLPSIYNQETNEYEPDWEYMEDFITNQQEKIKNQLKELR